MSSSKQERRLRRRRSIRNRIQGTAERPRLTVTRSLKHIYVQAIDDASGNTLAAASSLNDSLVSEIVEAGSDKEGNLLTSDAVGRALAQRLKEKGIEQVVFDRNGYLYHGRIQAIADAARDAGLNF